VSFRGWPAEAFDFFSGLEADNSKTYWQAHKDVWERAVKQPFAALSAEVESGYGALHLFRPYRDVRFSADKTPYKTAAGAVTESEGGASFYVQVSAAGLFVGSGMYDLATDQLERFREAVAADGSGDEIDGVCRTLRSGGYELGSMTSLKTAPRGYAKDHPRIELLRMKGLTMGRSFPRAGWMHTAKAFDRVRAVWDAARPMNAWLERHVGPSTLPPSDVRR
jgi:uncharacterized protein (TIGR02453 family)